MKNLMMITLLAFSVSSFAEEIPFPSNVTTMQNPTMNGYPFLAVDASEYYLQDTTPNFKVRPEIRASRVCKMLGFRNAYTFTEVDLGGVDISYNILVVNYELIAKPMETSGFKVGGKEYLSSVFQTLSCIKE